MCLQARDLSLIPGLGRSPEEGKGYPFQYAGLGNSMNCIVLGVKSGIQLNIFHLGFPGGMVGKESACNAGDLDLIPRLGISPGEGNGNLFQYSRLTNYTDRGAGQAEVHEISESDTTV